LISIFVRTIIIYVVLNIMLKIMGKRQIGELEVNELVSTLLISEVAAIPIGDSDIPLLNAFIPIVFITSLEVALSAIKNRSSLLKRVVEGESVYVIYKGELLQDVLMKNRISINEILTEMRIQGIGDISEVYYGILEQNGKLSLLTVDKKDDAAHTLVIDGHVDEKRLSEMGYDGKWLSDEVKKRGLSLSDIFLLTVKDDGSINIIERKK